MESGLQFDFTYAPGTSWEQMLAFETAGLMWSDYVKDDMTVNIHVEMTNTLPDNVIGGALPGIVADVNYTNFRKAYTNDITSWRDRRDFDSLSLLYEGTGGLGPNGSWEKFEARIDLGGDYFVEDSSELDMTRANAKALGLIAGDDAALDGFILMSDLSNTSLSWDYNKNWTRGSSLDFLSTAVHEVGHVLGFVSGVDKYQGFRFSTIDSFWNHFRDYGTFKAYSDNVLDRANPLDLFRYSSESLAINNGRNTIDMSIGTQAYFGPAKLWDAYAKGKETNLDGDGFQASHWKQRGDSNGIQGIMDPLMKPGVIRRISDRDLRAMDAIGYDANGNAEKLLARNTAANNWQPVTGSGTDLGILEWRAKDHIVKSRFSHGQTAWFDGWRRHKPADAEVMTRDRTWDVEQMIDSSGVYEARRSGSSRTTYRQEIFWQEAYFSTIADEYVATPVDLNSSPQPITVFNTESDLNKTATDFDNAADNQSTDTEIETAVDVSAVAVDLLSFADVQDAIAYVSTQLQTELIAEGSLYQNLAESELVMALG